MKCNLYDRKKCNRVSIKETGLFLQTVTEDIKSQDIIRYCLGNDVSKDLVTKISEAVKPVMCKKDRMTDLYIYSEKAFKSFCLSATKSTEIQSSTESEIYLMGNILYTDDTEFKENMIPDISDKAVPYFRDKVYCIRLIHKETTEGQEHKVDEIFIYIPNRYFN